MRKIAVIILFMAVFLISACDIAELPVQAQKSSDAAFDSIQDRITRLAATEMKQKQITGISMALVDENGIIFSVNLGYADLEKKKPVSSDTVFRVGSISKLFTATAIMQLVEEGKVDINKPLQSYIPEFSIKTRYQSTDPITLRSLMTHRSGLPGDYLPEMLNPEYPYFTTIVNDLKQEYAAYPPNRITAYSNLGSPLLGVVVERVSGQKFNDYVTDRILKPLAMKRSSFESRENMIPFLSKGYRRNKTAEDDISSNGIHPEGSLFSSVNEMSHFIQMVLRKGSFNENSILKETTLNEMMTPQPRLPMDLGGNGIDTAGSIGLNWFVYNDPDCGRIAIHPGGTRLFFSKLMILQDSGLGVIVLTNSADGNGLVSQIASEALVGAIKAKSDPVGYPGEQENASADIRPDPLKGYFATGMGWMKVEPDNKNFQLKVQKYPNVTFKLTKTNDGWNSLKPFFWGLFPVKISDLEGLKLGTTVIDGEHLLLANNNGTLSILGEKIDLAPIPQIWSKRCGNYTEIGLNGLSSLGYKIKLQLDKGIMLGYLFNKKGEKFGPWILTPVSDTELMIRGFGRNLHEIIQVLRIDGEEKLSYEGLIFKK